jgi:DNA invertase Pin-like site-specific DNA recombinase
MQVGYIRVSSNSDRQSTDLQRDALLAAGVDARHLYEDRASGARDDRPGLKACLDFMQSGDVLVVWKLDRLGRSLAHLIGIIQHLKNRGVGFRSLTEAIDTTTSMGEFVFNLFGSLAQYERSLIQERVHAGLAAAKRRGRIGGRPRRMDQAKIELAAKLLSAEEAISVSEVARLVGVPRSTLVDSLQRINQEGIGAGNG